MSVSQLATGRRVLAVAVSAALFLGIQTAAQGQQTTPYDMLPAICDPDSSNVIVFDGSHYLTWEDSRYSLPLSATNFEIDVGATYSVTLVSYDNHTSKEVPDTQEFEQWKLALTLGSDVVYTSPATPDLGAGVDWGTYLVDSDASIGGPVDTVIAIHDQEGISQRETQSIWPVCAVFESVTEPPPDDPGVAVVEKATNGADADDPSGTDVPAVEPGDTVTWTYTVTNDGGSPIADVVVVDDQEGIIAGPSSGDTNNNGLLDPTETWLYQATSVAADLTATTPGVVDGCPDPTTDNPQPTYRNTATITGITTGTTVTDTDLSHYCNPPDTPPVGVAVVEKATNGADADDPSGTDVPAVEPGDTVTWTYTVTNDGGSPIADVVVVDDQEGIIAGPSSGDTNNNGLLDPTETWLYQATSVAADLTATTPGVVDGCPDPTTDNPQPTYRNTATITGITTGTTVTDTDLSHYCNPPDTPPVGVAVVEKATNGADADDPSGTDVPAVEPGDTVTWTYTVTNDGGSPIADVVVVDDQEGIIAGPSSGDTNNNGLLDPTETWLYQATSVAADLTATTPGVVDGCPDPTTDNPQPTYRNTATITGITTGTTVTDTDLSHYCNPPDTPPVGVAVVEKATNGADADDPSGTDVPAVEPGDTVTWTYTVTNDGGSPIADVVVVDDQEGIIAGPSSGDTNNNGLLDPTETWLYQATSVAADLTATTPGVVDGCPDPTTDNPQPTYRNTATITGITTGTTVTDTDLSHYCNPPPPKLTALISDTVDGPLSEGEPFSYTVFVANLGGEPTAATNLEVRMRSADGSRVKFVAAPAQVRAAAADRQGSSCSQDQCMLVVDAIAPGDYVQFVVSAEVVKADVATVIAQVREGNVLLDEEPVLFADAGPSGYPGAVAAAVLDASLVGGEFLLAADLQLVVPTGVPLPDPADLLGGSILPGSTLPATALPATGADADLMLWLALMLLGTGSALVALGRTRPGRARG